MATMTLVRREREKKEGTMMTPGWEETLLWTKEGVLTNMTTMVRANGGKRGDANDNSGKGMGKGGDSEKEGQARMVMAMSCPQPCFGNKSGSRCLVGPPIMDYFGRIHCGSCYSAISSCVI
jgi:hypothetical protein